MKAGPSLPVARKKVLIVNDHPLLREGLAKVINQQEDLVVCGEADGAHSGLAGIAKCRPDAVMSVETRRR